MAEPDRQLGHRSLFHFGVRRVAEKRPPPEVDRAEVERDVEAKVPGPAAAAAPQQLVWVRIVCQPGAPAGGDIAQDIGLFATQPQPAPAPVSKNRARAAAQPCVEGVGRGGGPVT